MLPPSRLYENADTNQADAAIQLTDTDAALARLSAVQKNYLADEFIKAFVSRAYLQPPRPPLINIGTYLRSEALDELVGQWIELAEKEGRPCQIVSLGAGSDTRFWRIATGPKKAWVRSYVEVDFAENMSKKAKTIRRNRDLSAVLDGLDIVPAHGSMTLHAPVYHLIPADLRMDPAEVLGPHLSGPPPSGSEEPIISPSYPTLLLFECALVYMEPSASSRLIQWFVDYFSSSAGPSGHAALGGIVYEMFGLQDAFGQVMLNNLQARGVTLPGARPYPTRSSLTDRFTEHGFTMSNALTLRDIRHAYIKPAELDRIAQLEMLDEIEELDLVLEHYAITWGVKVSPSVGCIADWTTWGLRPQPRHPELTDEE